MRRQPGSSHSDRGWEGGLCDEGHVSRPDKVVFLQDQGQGGPGCAALAFEDSHLRGMGEGAARAPTRSLCCEGASMLWVGCFCMQTDLPAGPSCRWGLGGRAPPRVREARGRPCPEGLEGRELRLLLVRLRGHEVQRRPLVPLAPPCPPLRAQVDREGQRLLGPLRPWRPAEFGGSILGFGGVETPTCVDGAGATTLCRDGNKYG